MNMTPRGHESSAQPGGGATTDKLRNSDFSTESVVTPSPEVWFPAGLGGSELWGLGTEALGVTLGQQRTALGHNSPHRHPRALSQTSQRNAPDDTWQNQKRH